MKNFSSLLLLATVMFLSATCDKNTDIETDESKIQDLTAITAPAFSLTKSQTEITGSINDFNYDLFREVYEDGDMFISPFSVSLALSMLTNGAAGNTETELLNTLGFEGKSVADLNSYYKALIEHMTSADPKTTLAIANAIWASNNTKLKDAFTKNCAQWFNSTSESVDFSSSNTITKLNAWASDHTNGKIDHMFDSLPRETVCILANALYFNSIWPFIFTKKEGRLKAKVKTTYFEGTGFTGIELPYGNGAFAMRIILPDDGVSAKTVADSLEGSYMESCLKGSSTVDVDIPEFTFSYEKIMDEALKALGIHDAYDPLTADFSSMTDDDFYVGTVKQKTYVSVNEKGTEAAAVTAVVMVTTSIGPHLTVPSYVEFTVNRDFIFEILDRSSGAVIFLGQHKL